MDPKKQPTIEVLRLRPEAVVPERMSSGAAGLDLSAAIDSPLTLAPGKRAVIATGLAVSIPSGFEGQVRPRSGLARKHGLTLVNSPGTIDSDYRGEISVLLINLGEEPVEIVAGQRIAQLVVAAVALPQVTIVSSLDETDRGAGGFGSTGK